MSNIKRCTTAFKATSLKTLGAVMLVCLWSSTFSSTAKASFISPLGISLWPRVVQFPGHDGSVVGLRLNLLGGEHENVYGLDLGLVANITSGYFVGSAFSGFLNAAQNATILGAQVAIGFNSNGKNAYIAGLQFGGISNYNSEGAKILGLQVATLANVNGRNSYQAGVQFALLANYSIASNILGFQIAGSNYVGTIVGAQVGLYNKAQEVYGFQIGLLNVATYLHGIQIGLLNIHKDGMLPYFPIVNIGF